MNNWVKYTLILVLVLVLVVIALALYFIGGPMIKKGLDQATRESLAELPPCGLGEVFLTESPVNMGQLEIITPLGSLSPQEGHVFPVDHVYLRTVAGRWTDGGETSGAVDVQAPGEVWLTRVAFVEYEKEGTVIDKDYSLYFSPCEEIEMAYYHVKSLDPALEAKLDLEYDHDHEYLTGGHNQLRREAEVTVRLAAGEVMGKAGGTGSGQAFDFRAVDRRREPIKHANAGRWQDSQSYIVCPFDYYGGAMKEKFMTLMGEGQKRRTAEPLCGTVEQDLSGTAQGAWFAEEVKKSFPEDPHLALVHDEVNPRKPIFSVGTAMGKSGLAPGLYEFEVGSRGVTNRDFNEVNETGRIYCYQGVRDRWGKKINKVILLELIGGDDLRMEARAGLSCAGIDRAFSDRVTFFER